MSRNRIPLILSNLAIGATLAILGSSCNLSVGGSPDKWVVLSGGPMTVPPSESRTVDITVQNVKGTTAYEITTAAVDPIPTGWTVTGSTRTLPMHGGATVGVPVTVAVPAGETTGLRTLTISVSDNDNPQSTVQVVLAVTVGAAGVTVIRESSPFSLLGDQVYESGVEISNGEGVPITTMVETRTIGFTAVVDALVWLNPNAGGFSVDPGDTDILTCSVLPRTNKVARTFAFENYFFFGVDEFKYATQVSSTVPTNVTYEITALDWLMGVFLSDPDKVTTYTVVLDPVLTNRAGQYSLSVVGLNPQYTATVNPPTAALNSAGDPVTVEVTITRVGSGTGETVDDFNLRATHDVFPEMNLFLRMPIRTYVGR